VSRPTAMRRAEVEAQRLKANATYTEIRMTVDVLDGVITREHARFGPDSELAGQLMRISALLAMVRQDAESRARA
jgi:hypothetical protein